MLEKTKLFRIFDNVSCKCLWRLLTSHGKLYSTSFVKKTI